MNNINLPALGEGIEKAIVAMWQVKVGDYVHENDDIVELVIDKATFNVPSIYSGRITEILVQEGEEVKIGQALAVIDVKIDIKDNVNITFQNIIQKA